MLQQVKQILTEEGLTLNQLLFTVTASRGSQDSSNQFK